ncbi:hypothetical protein [Variovorax sp.]|uniref:hypothetical protein n=1 Tax=Variovorax sp. TaxID=1871043 RepID=UPI004037F733
MKRFALLAAVAGFAAAIYGCGSVSVQPVRVPIPVECRVAEPARPAMPTETLVPPVDIDQFAKAAMAEIELREGYEGELLAAVRSCIRPLGETVTVRPSP